MLFPEQAAVLTVHLVSACRSSSQGTDAEQQLLAGIREQLAAVSAEEGVIVEHCLRAAVSELTAGQDEAAMARSTGEGGSPLRCALDTALACAQAGLSTRTAPILVLEDLMDGLTVAECAVAFGYVEEQKAPLAALLRAGAGLPRTDPIAKSCSAASLYLLRLCNGLLRRLSKASEGSFCGRILMCVAYVLPLAERSGVNLQHAYNTDNKTAYSTPEEVAEGGDGAVDYLFYSKFWAMQEVFMSPAGACEPAAFEACAADVKLLLDAFESKGSEDDREQDAAGAAGGEEGQYQPQERDFSKFLTSPHLMSLQLRDPYFRRHVLVQLLVFLQAIRRGAKKDRQPELRKPQAKAAAALEERALALLERIPPGGARFVQSIRRILLREENWVSWKRENCKDFERLPSKAAAGDELPGMPMRKRHRTGPDLGNPELTRLWGNGGNELEGLVAQLPDLKQFLRACVDEKDEDEDYKHKNDSAFVFKALRLMVNNQLASFSAVATGKDGATPTDCETVALQLHGLPPKEIATAETETTEAEAKDVKVVKDEAEADS